MNHTHTIRATISEFTLPPIEDVLVMGCRSPIGHLAMTRALDLISTTPYRHVAVEDDVVADIIVREPILRRLDEKELVSFVLSHVKPFMGADDVLHVRLEVETQVTLQPGAPR